MRFCWFPLIIKKNICVIKMVVIDVQLFFLVILNWKYKSGNLTRYAIFFRPDFIFFLQQTSKLNWYGEVTFGNFFLMFWIQLYMWIKNFVLFWIQLCTTSYFEWQMKNTKLPWKARVLSRSYLSCLIDGKKICQKFWTDFQNKIKTFHRTFTNDNL